VPGQTTAGRKTDALVEFVDIYPTLVELCGLRMPADLEGTSFRPLLEKPDQPWKRAAFSQQPREFPGYGSGMGYTLRTARYRFTEWTVAGRDYRAQELYDYKTDPLETENLAGQPEFARIEKELSGLLRGGWRAAVPPAK
jgi:arylsulfatase A-like enzyme